MDQTNLARPESCNCFLNTFDEFAPIPTSPKQATIPKIRPPPQSPRRSRPSSTHSTLSLNPDIDFITFDNPPEGPSPIRRSSQSLRANSRAEAMNRRQKQEPRLPVSASLVLPRKKKKPFDPDEWKAYVEAAFPVMEDKGDFEIKIETSESKQEKTNLKALPQAAKMKQYSKLKQQSSIEEFRDEEMKPKLDEIKIKHDDSKTKAGETSLSLAEKRRRFLLRKQTHSAPDAAGSTDDEIASNSTDSRARRTTNLCMGGRCRARGSDSSIQPPPSIRLDPDVGIEHLDDLKYPDGGALCHFCEKECSQSIHDEARLKIVSGGLIQTRDGSSTELPSQYMNLPSPMLKCEEDGRVSFQQQLEQWDTSKEPVPTLDEYDDVLPEGQLPPPNVLARRKALALSSLRADAQRQKLTLDEFTRRSSTVVYPDMQICPGDLMVYSKALINSQLVKDKSKHKSESEPRKGTWSILRIFARHKKAGSITGLEIFLDQYNRTLEEKDCLSRYRRVTWTEFYIAIRERKERKRLRRSQRENRRENPFELYNPNSSDDDVSTSSSSGGTASDDTCICSSDAELDSDGVFDVETATLSSDQVPDPPSSAYNENYDFSLDEDTIEEKLLRTEEADSFAISPGPSRFAQKDDEFPTGTLKSKSSEFSSRLTEGRSRSKVLKRAQSSQQFSTTDLEQGVAKISLEEPGALKKSDSLQKSNSQIPKATPRLSRQLSDLFKKKDTIEKVWIDKGKAEKQETAMTRFQKRLTRTQSERVMGICRLASWKQKEKPIVEPQSPALSSEVSFSQGEYKRREAVWDLFQTECAFLIDHLCVLRYVFMNPLKAAQVEGFLMFTDPQLLFGNLEDLQRVTKNFCKTFIRLLKKRVGPNGELPTTRVLQALFKKDHDGDVMTQAYHSYALNYINALTYLETLRSFEAFNVFEKWCGTDGRCRKLQLTDFLVAPVQHIMKIPLLLKEILNKTENKKEVAIIQAILHAEEKSLRQLDDKMQWLKNYEHLLELQKSITWTSVLEMEPKLFVPEFIKPALKKQVCDRVILSPRRRIINEGPIFCWDSGKPIEMILLLFDDMLLITRKKKLPKKSRPGLADSLITPCHCGSVYKQPLALDRIHLYEPSVTEMLSSRMENLFILIVVSRFQQIVMIHTFQTFSREQKESWVTLLRESQENFKKNLETSIFRSGSPVHQISAQVRDMKLNDIAEASPAAAVAIARLSEDTPVDIQQPSTSTKDFGILDKPGPLKMQFLAPPSSDKQAKRKISI